MSKVSSLSVLFKWNKVKSTPSKTQPRSRCKHACCIHNEYVYIIGGKAGNLSLKDFCRFHLGTHSWEELTYKGDKIPYFEGHSLVSYKRILLLFGGVHTYDLSDSALWIFNPDLQYLRRHVPDVGSTHPCSRRHHTAVVYNNVMYVYGGYIDLQGSTSDIWAYHIDDEEWDLIKPNQRTDNTAGSRHGHSAVVYGREMWVFGGMSGLHAKADFWKFNFHSLKWDKIKTKFGPPCLSGHTATVVKDYMVVIGGDNNGTLSGDIWIFGLCTLKWTHYQPTHLYPPPCKWHTVVPVTTWYKMGDKSVRTTSLPYLKNKLKKNRSNRPQSSPAYSSARFPRKTHEQHPVLSRPTSLALKPDNEGNQNNSAAHSIEMKPFSDKNIDRRSPFKGNGFTEGSSREKEDKSPLLCNRQTSKDSILSTGSGLGTDNPCLELDSSSEKVNQFTSCRHGRENFENSVELTDLTPFSHQNEPCRKSQIITRFVKNDKPQLDSSDIPGQINTSPNNDNVYMKKNFRIDKPVDIVFEDLEFCDNYFGSDIKTSIKHASDHNVKHSSDQSTNWRSSFHETEFNGHFEGKLDNSLDGKSYSLSDISQTHPNQVNSIYKSTSMNIPQSNAVICRKCSLNCWIEETETSLIEEAKESESRTKDCKSESRVSKIVSQQDKEKVQRSDSKDSEECPEVINENGPPYLLLFGGHHEKNEQSLSSDGTMTVWQCDVLVRHSDISHGEFHKSSLVI